MPEVSWEWLDWLEPSFLWVLLLMVVAGGWMGGRPAQAANRVRVAGRLQARDWLAKFDEEGNLISLSNGELELVSRSLALDNTPRLRFGDSMVICRRPRHLRTAASELVYDYRLSGSGWAVDVRYEVTLEGVGSRSVGLVQKVTLRPHQPLRRNFALILPLALRLPVRERFVFAPLKEGVGEESLVSPTNRSWAFYAAGSFLGQNVTLLAIPMIDEFSPSTPFRLTFCADPYFTTLFQVPLRPEPGAFQCVYKAQDAPLTAMEERTFYTVIHQRDAEGAMLNLYRTALADIPPGPDWLHDIALVHYDYLSDGGEGWFREIDWLTQRLAPEERSKVCLVLHGWYDLVGRYTYLFRYGRLEEEWTAFPRAEEVRAQFPRSCSLPMSRAEVHRRLRYAKERGFRVVLYFAHGLAVCEGARDVYRPEKVLYSGGWQGPDTMGPTHIQNPLHPEVRQWFKGYLNALLQEYGREIDGLLWDATFHIDPSHLGPPSCPGYAVRAMMTLVRELAEMTHRYRKDCAFLTVDCHGGQGWHLKVPYALVADGACQEGEGQPQAQGFGIFPNYRNVLWLFHRHPLSRFEEMRRSVEERGMPVSLASGWGEDGGISEMPSEMAERVLELFHRRKEQRTSLRWLLPKEGAHEA